MIDIVFCNVPMVHTERPLSAPAILKAVVEKHGFTAQTLDFNIDFNSEDTDPKLQDFWLFGGGDKNTVSQANKSVEDWAKQLLDCKPRWIGISVFAYTCKIATELLCLTLRSIDPKVKIMIGGNGMGSGGINGDYSWAEDLKVNRNLIDAYIRSEGEDAVIQLLQGNVKYPGINHNEKTQQIKDLDNFPAPNYFDYQLDKYKSNALPITGSRGCVRHCTFCDIHTHWKKFVFRSGESICDEMKNLAKQHKSYKFAFTDSLVNGSMKAYRDFIKHLSEYNSVAENKLSWSGQFIARSSTQMTEEDWRLTKLSGADQLAIGVETGSNKVRNDMQKKFSNDDLDFCVDMAYKYKVKIIMLMMIGYPTEKYEDFQDTVDMFTRYAKYKDVLEVSLGTTLAILPLTPLYDFAIENNFDMGNSENEWWWKENPDLTLKERLRRRVLIGQHCNKLGYVMDSEREQLQNMAYIWNNHKNNIKLSEHKEKLETKKEQHQQFYS